MRIITNIKEAFEKYWYKLKLYWERLDLIGGLDGFLSSLSKLADAFAYYIGRTFSIIRSFINFLSFMLKQIIDTLRSFRL